MGVIDWWNNLWGADDVENAAEVVEEIVEEVEEEAEFIITQAIIKIEEKKSNELRKKQEAS